MKNIILKNGCKEFSLKDEKIIAMNNVNLQFDTGKMYVIMGHSGSGKSTMIQILGLLDNLTSGELYINGQEVSKYSENEKADLRMKEIGFVFQSFYLNPKLTAIENVMLPMYINKNIDKKERKEKAMELLRKFGLENRINHYPKELSGGEQQRIAIARALILKPKLIIADEPVSAVDASIQAQIINLLNDLKKEFNLTILFISHDLSVIKYLSDKVAVMYLGEILEQGLTSEIYDNPTHPYTKALLNAVPKFGKSSTELLQGDLPLELPEGCKFFSRCKFSNDECVLKCPKFIELSDTHKVRCIN